MHRSALLALCVLAGAATSALAQASHLPSVPIKDFASIQVNHSDDGAGTVFHQWAEKRYGVGTTFDGDIYTPATTKKETFVITDAEFTIFCKAAPGTTANPGTVLFSPLLNDATGAGFIFITRVHPTLTARGRETVRVSFTSGVVVPPGFTFTFPGMTLGDYEVQRAIFFGYYTK